MDHISQPTTIEVPEYFNIVDINHLIVMIGQCLQFSILWIFFINFQFLNFFFLKKNQKSYLNLVILYIL
jgi:hypothetical protein